MPFSIIEVQQTPNPNAAKFVLDQRISEAPVSFLNADQGQSHPIAKQLFAIPGVASLLFLGDFVTVNKIASASWPTIKKKVKQVLAEV
jgi:NFU1 iron-sulfur cluster scaffold homolog, mitochondrial